MVVDRGEPHGLCDEERGPLPRHEDMGVDEHPGAAELRPTENVFQWFTLDPARNQSLELRRGAGFGDEQVGLVLGEHTAGRAQPSYDERDVVVRQGRILSPWVLRS